MDNVFLIALAISVCYVAFKLVDTHLIRHEPVVIKDVIRDGILAYLSAVAGYYGIKYAMPSSVEVSPVKVFTDSPNF
jgi:hypothetical protein